MRIRRPFAIAVILLASLPSARRVGAQQPALAGLARADSMVAAEFARDSVASLTVGVVTPLGLVWTRSYGFANMTTRRLANRQSVYRIGSITKMFTALMLHQLVEAGKIRLSDPVERYYPEIREIRGYGQLEAPITVQQLATMTSGIAREPEQEGPFWTGPVATWDSTLHLALPHTHMQLAPGTQFLYSNIGYAILGATLGRAVGVPYVRWQKEHVLDPLGLRHTTFEIDASIAPDLATGYDVSNGRGPDASQAAREAITGRGYKVPNGAIFTTIDDLSRFLVLQLGHGPEGVVPRARLDSAYNGTVNAAGQPIVSYGIGFTVEQSNTLTWFGHGGGVAGYTSMMAFDGKRELGVIVLRNAAGGEVRPGRLAVDLLGYLVAANAAGVYPRK